MIKGGKQKFRSNVKDLLEDLSGPDYITGFYKDLGIGSLIILKGVFRADKSYLGNYLAETLCDKKSLYRNKTILDLGCGCGALGIICAIHGAKKVHFSDINPVAIKNSRLNSTLLDINNVSFSCGSLFNNLPSKARFDVIVFNPPSIPGSPSSVSEAALIREDKLMLNFYKSFPSYLKKKGIVIMPGSSRFDSNLSPRKTVERYNIKYKMLAKEREDDGNYKYIISFGRK